MGATKKIARLTVMDIAKDLGVGKMRVYTMLEDGELPAIRVGHGWIVTRLAYADWKRKCGTRQRVIGMAS